MVVGLAANQTQVQRIIQSKAFRTSELHRNLLQYLSEKSLSGTADGLKEYTVGLDVFAKPESYDPRQESMVRMHVARLRQKLAEYYQTDGAADSMVIGLPKGGFKIFFTTRAELSPAPEPIVIQPEDSRKKWVAIGAMLAALVIAPFVIA